MTRRSVPTRPFRRLGALLATALVASLAGAAPPARAGSQVFNANADARVAEADPSTNYGRLKTLETDASPQVESYVRFMVSGLSGVVQSARLRLWATNATVDGPAAYATGTSWSEKGLTWNNRPSRTSGAVGDLGPVAADTWVEIDVTAAVTGDGTYSFALASVSADNTVFASREQPRRRLALVVETGVAADTTAPDTTITSGPTGDVTSTSASFGFTANETGARFECRLDTAAFSACTSATSYSGLPLGEHSFEVRAIDGAGNVDQTPASRSWRVVEGGSIRDTLLAPSSGALWGAHHKISASLSIDEKKAALTDFEALLGRKLGIDHYYEPWNNVFPEWRESWDLANGRIPMISWGKTLTTDITSGKYDSYIRARADGIKSLGQPVFLRWFWEMDGSRNADIAVSPSAYSDAWKYLRARFAERGATNVAWVWCPNASGFEDGSAQSFYPGDAHVDWVCSDGYNWYPSDGREYQGFEEKFQAFHDFAVAHDKPAMAGEYGSQKMEDGRRAIWLNDARDAVKNRMTNMLAVVYFHSYSADYYWQFYNEPDAMDAFSAMGLDLYFR